MAATQYIQAGGRGQDTSLKFRMGKEGELSDFGCWCQADLVGCSHKTISRVYGERYAGIQRMGRPVQMIQRGHEVK